MAQALKSYERHIVCLEKTPADATAALRSLLEKAILAFETRAAGLRHGIALDRHITIILSQSEGEQPWCAIYFNLHTPYHKRTSEPPARSAKL